MSVLQHRRPERPPVAERPRGVQPARLGCAPGTSRGVLDTLMSAGTREAYRRSGELMGELRAAVAQERATYVLTGYVLDDTEAALAALAFQLTKLIKSGTNADHTTRMLLMPVKAQFAELLPAAHSTWDHRPLNVAVGTELPDRQWFNDIPDGERSAAPVDARQRNATRASWLGEVGAKNRPPAAIGRDPFHEPGNPRCVCTECSVAAVVACAPADDDEAWPFQYSRAQHDGDACARCGREFAVGELRYAVVTDESNEMFRHSLPEQCGPVVAPWSDDDKAGTEAAR